MNVAAACQIPASAPDGAQGRPRIARPRIAIVHPEGNAGSNTNMRAIILALLRHGWSVDYIHHATACAHDLHDVPFFSDLELPAGLPLACAGGEWRLMLAVDAGVLDAAAIRQTTGLPFLLLNYENFFLDEARTARERAWVRDIHLAARSACAAITQDSVRAASMADEYGLECELTQIPVAGAGTVERRPSTALHRICGIPEGKKILLHLGSLDSWCMADWLAAHAAELPDDWVLVLHGRYGIEKPPFPEHEKCRFSRVPARTQAELSALVQSAACCAALYSPTYDSLYTGRNIAEIGLSSTKFSLALQHGVPVLVNGSNAMQELVLERRCGIVIDPDAPRPLDALARVDMPAAGDCHDAFAACLDFNRHAATLLDLVDRHSLPAPARYRPDLSDRCVTAFLDACSGRQLVHSVPRLGKILLSRICGHLRARVSPRRQ